MPRLSPLELVDVQPARGLDAAEMSGGGGPKGGGGGGLVVFSGFLPGINLMAVGGRADLWKLARSGFDANNCLQYLVETYGISPN